MEKIILNLLLSKLKGIDINALIKEGEALFNAEIAQLKLSGGATSDFVKLEADFATVFAALADAVKLIEAADTALKAIKK